MGIGSKLATEKMHAHLTDPEFVKERAAERAKELARLEREAGVDWEAAQGELGGLTCESKNWSG